MFVYGLYFGTRHWPWLGTRGTDSARGNKQLSLFGRERQVGAILFAAEIPIIARAPPLLERVTTGEESCFLSSDGTDVFIITPHRTAPTPHHTTIESSRWFEWRRCPSRWPS